MVIDGLQRISTIKSFFVEQTLTLKGLEFLTELHGKKCDVNRKTNSCPAILLLEIPTTSLKLSCSTIFFRNLTPPPL
jgi:hypothetical protein